MRWSYCRSQRQIRYRHNLIETSVKLKKQYHVCGVAAAAAQRRAVSRYNHYFNIRPLKLINIISKLFPTIPQSKSARQTLGDEMFLFPDNLSDALEKLKIASTDSATDSVESCLDCLLKALANNSEYRHACNLHVRLSVRLLCVRTTAQNQHI